MLVKLRPSMLIVFIQWAGLTSFLFAMLILYVLLAVLQWAVMLRRYLPKAAWWPLMSGAAYGFWLVLMLVLSHIEPLARSVFLQPSF